MTSGRPPQPVPPLDALHPDDKNDHHARLLHAAASIAAADLLNRHNASAVDSSTTSSSSLAPRHPASSTREDTSTTTTSSTPPFPAGQIQFQSHTIAPSPPPETSPAVPTTPPQPPETATAPHQTRYHPSPLGSGVNALHIQTDVHPSTPVRSHNLTADRPSLQHKSSASSLKPVSRTPSLKTGSLATALGTASAASSTVASPIIAAMGDVTPLPSPLLSSDSPGPWKKLARPPSREATPTPLPAASDSVLVSSAGESIAAAMAYQDKRKVYADLESPMGAAGGKGARPEAGGGPASTPHARNRSISEYIPDPLLMPKRTATVTGAHSKADPSSSAAYRAQLRREPHLSQSRGLTPLQKPPTPPPSESSSSTNDPSSVNGTNSSSRKPAVEYFEARGRHDRKRRRWRAVKMIGQGTFSRVMLATSQVSSTASDDDEEETKASARDTLSPGAQSRYDRRTLVAVKVCEHGPRGGASEERIEMSLKRELEIMQSIHHPSLVHLKAWNIEPTRAILVLSYCPGGDLFDVASTHREFLSPNLMRRIFSELVGATTYLHERKIVHRDIKLENVLVNIPPSEIATTNNWTTYPYPVVTLTDLGLSRRIASDERLETRCGSDDYAAPEVIMGQPYDGRATDAWSLGVLLYALLESRLPFDPAPGAGDHAAQVRMRSRTSHRIARVEWRWVEYGATDDGDAEGDHEADAAKFAARGLQGAREVVEGLLKRARSRWSLGKVAETEWVAGGVKVEGGIRFREEEEGEEIET